MSSPIPFLVWGDSPFAPSGLGRIARDLASRLHAAEGRLGLRVAQAGWHPRGVPAIPFKPPWPVWTFQDTGDNYGADVLAQVWREWAEGGRGAVLTIWDPGRCLPLVQAQLPGADRWGYFAIDAANIHGMLSGPAGDAVSQYDRVLGYGAWGASVLRTVRSRPVSWLPHGMETSASAFAATEPAGMDDLCRQLLGPYCTERRTLIGVVAANQPRKDYGLAFQAAAALRDQQKEDVFLWIHTDHQIGLQPLAWSLPQLAMDFGFEKRLAVTTDQAGLGDQVLAALYRRCAATLAPGLGEGFGYPIVESLAAGTPVVHGDCAGGRELTPPMWRVSAETVRLEGHYALVRPVFDPRAVGERLAVAINHRREQPALVSAYCRGAVAHLDWRMLWPRWESWIRKGVEAL